MSKVNDNVYLDYAASTPVRPEVVEAMQPYWRDQFANPQSSHKHGRKAREGLQAAREQIAETLLVQPSEVIFTSGATEANNLAIQGRCVQQDEKSVAAVSAGSHPSMLSNDKTTNFRTQKLQLSVDGRIDLSELRDKVGADTAVVSVPYVNSAIGAIEPLREISNSLDDIKSQDQPAFHTDASQAGCFLPLTPESLGVDMMTVSSHKLHGPKGVGLLWVRSGTSLSSVFLSESDRVVGDYQVLRPGTPPVPLIVGFAKALSIAQKNYKQASQRVSELRNYTIEKIRALSADIVLNGDEQSRVANNVHFSISGSDHDYVAAQLDQKGISVATSTACQSNKEKSPMLAKIPDTPNTGLRVTLGLSTDQEDIDLFIEKLKAIITDQ